MVIGSDRGEKSMEVRLKYFARYREMLNCEEETLEVETDISTNELTNLLAKRSENWAAVFINNEKLLIAINHSISHENVRLQHGDEVAFYPPVTGG